MNSPEPETDVTTLTSTLSPNSSSPAVQESPFHNFVNRLSPIKSVTASTLRCPESALFILPPVFTSPRIDLQRETSFLERDDNDAVSFADGQGCSQLTVFSNSSLDKDIQSCSRLDCIDEYLEDPLESEVNMKSSDSFFPPVTEMTQLAHSDFTSSRGTSLDSKAIDDALEENMKTENMSLSNVSDVVGYYTSVKSLLSAETVAEHGDEEKFNESTRIIAESNRNWHLVSAAPRSEFVEVLGDQQCASHRHLQFKSRRTGNNNGSSDCNIVCTMQQESENSSPPTNATNSNLVSSHVVTTAVIVGCVQSIESGSSSDSIDLVDSTHCLTNSTSFPTPSGFNSISRWSSTGKKLSSCSNSEERKLGTDSKECPDKDATASMILVSSEQNYALDNEHRGSLDVEPLVAPCEGKTSAPQSALNLVSPPQKRRKSYTSENEGSKRCHCKKSKCLKLYCECFAAGDYCMDSCACEDCFNKPAFEDTVIDTRKKAESRNPLAFAPRIVRETLDSPARIMEEGNRTTPSSARHKRGCNCKKSRCLKKYCECYQAKVGCSVRCHCECCHNSFGTKAACRRAGQREKPADQKIDAGENSSKYIKICSANGFSSTREAFKDVSNLTPLSHCTREAVASDLTNRSGCPQTSEARYQSLISGPFHLSHFPETLSPQLCQSNVVSYKPCSDRLYDTMKENVILRNATPTKILKATSPNPKQSSPLHFQSEGLGLNSQSDLRGGRRFIWQTMPTFPPLTPYKNSNGRLTQNEGDHRDYTSDQ